jgi:hypothetical protein
MVAVIRNAPISAPRDAAAAAGQAAPTDHHCRDHVELFAERGRGIADGQIIGWMNGPFDVAG